MITINQVLGVDPNFVRHLNAYSLMQWSLLGEDGPKVLKLSEIVWLVTEEKNGDHDFLFLAGVHRNSLVGGLPTLWLLGGTKLSARHVRHMDFLLETLRGFYPGEINVAVNSGDLPQQKFATFFGFQYSHQTPGLNHYRMN